MAPRPTATRLQELVEAQLGRGRQLHPLGGVRLDPAVRLFEVQRRQVWPVDEDDTVA